eukprot:CAMPEP_0194205690 /NCGR_PEP_ID=MMETSP0156-20130528/4909_1 /TAXON_ID=33649 /ORGANISM="Thalassionema nitzschioides, Strain L26-B" /LENGTH=1620 /DNA_ID=CAMNT_0038932039 /DNA_START=162 /DNA_END=5024 /DNA_ORIENTATION=+
MEVEDKRDEEIAQDTKTNLSEVDMSAGDSDILHDASIDGKLEVIRNQIEEVGDSEMIATNDLKEAIPQGESAVISEDEIKQPNDGDSGAQKSEGDEEIAVKKVTTQESDKKNDTHGRTLSIFDNRDPYTLSFENLTVHVPGVKSGCCNCLSKADNPFGYLLQEYGGVSVQERDPFYALDGISGYLKSGELCLVLGGSDQSKSTLLRALSGRLNESDDVSGTILLNGIPMPRSDRGWRKTCPYVSSSDATHSAVLTVRETFTFAAECTMGSSSGDVIKDEVDQMMSRLGLSHVADTVVGDENLRGISGGQKRRVTFGEMMLNESCRFMCCENITDGLSSADSLSLIENINSACKKYRTAAMISLLQPSDEMIEIFDKLLVLTSQGLAYFGPVDREKLAEAFLQEQAGDHHIGSICDLVLKHSLSGSAEEESALVKKYVSSEIYKQTVVELAQLRANAPPAPDRDIHKLIPNDHVTKSSWYQFTVISARRIKLICRNAVTWTRIIIAIVFGVIIGSLFSALGESIAGALGRTGFIFLNCFLVLMLSAAVTIPSSFRERVTLFKHRSAEFYDGRIAYLAQLVTDAPLSLFEAILLSCISYFWVGMNQNAGAFFYFMGTLIALEFAGQALGRLLCAVCNKQVTANAMSSVVILIFGTVGGFMPPYGGIVPLLRWLSWITPVSYAFEGLMLNQFSGTSFDSVATVGAEGIGELSLGDNPWLSVYNLPRNKTLSHEAIRIWDIFMVFFFAIIYDLLGYYYIERTRALLHNQTRRPQSTVKNSFSMSAPLRQDTSGQGDKQDTHTQETDWPQCLTIRDLSYKVSLKSKTRKLKPVQFVRRKLVMLAGKESSKDTSEKMHEDGTLTLLHKVNARFCRGRMTALMGTSGAGKTTLMDVIAGYKTGGVILGDILIDGCPKDPNVWKKISGYAEQNDILNPYLTVIETLRFTANCRLPRNVDKHETIRKILKLMNLDEWKDYVVGREIEGEGLPKHARKRLTIAIQLVIQPKILFLDEPTTGLGTNAASLVISAVRSATDVLGLITVATIHQPSKLIWDTFDDILLLGRSNLGGRAAYMGESGQNSENVLNHFASIKGETPSTKGNPADFCLGVLDKMDAAEAEEIFQETSIWKDLSGKIDMDHEDRKDPPPLDSVTKSVNNPFREFLLLTVRHMIVQWRNPSYCLMRIISSMVMSLYVGLLFSGDKSSLNGAVFSIGAIFFLVFVLVVPMQAAVVPLVEDRAVLYRETVSGTYSRFSYGLGQLVADQPFHLLNTIIMFLFFYFLVGFRLEGEQVGYFILMLYLANWVIQSLGQLFALVTPNEESANGLGGLSVILSVILMGFLISVSMMPDGWVWAYWVNLFHYMLQGFVTNEVANNSYQIDLSGIVNELGYNVANSTHIVAFDGNIDSVVANQVSSFMSLVVNDDVVGVNEGGDLDDLIRCTIDSECFTEDKPPATSFIQCYMNPIFPKSPCIDEFQAVLENVNVTAILQCLRDADPDNAPNELTNSTLGDLGKIIAEEDTRSQLETILCLMKALLPPDKIDAIMRLVAIIKDVLGVLMIFIEICDGSHICLYGEVILWFFGWATFDPNEGGLIAPYKWWYCMGSVAIFLGTIEVLKLFAVRFIVWTKR